VFNNIKTESFEMLCLPAYKAFKGFNNVSEGEEETGQREENNNFVIHY
jgi:hypothetical protein